VRNAAQDRTVRAVVVRRPRRVAVRGAPAALVPGVRLLTVPGAEAAVALGGPPVRVLRVRVRAAVLAHAETAAAAPGPPARLRAKSGHRALAATHGRVRGGARHSAATQRRSRSPSTTGAAAACSGGRASPSAPVRSSGPCAGARPDSAHTNVIRKVIFPVPLGLCG
jgi:hypothetical protein